MNVKNLYVGMEIKNYKKLCEILEEPIKNGNSKKAHLLDMQRYFSYEKKGNGFIIKEIFDTPKAKINSRGSNGKYSKDIQELLIDILAQSPKGELIFCTSKLLKELNLVNENYSMGRRNVPKLAELINISENEIYDFYDITHTNLKGTLECALDNLRRRGLLMWKKETTIAKVSPVLDENQLGETRLTIKEDTFNTNSTIATKETHRLATTKEKQLILSAEAKALDKLGFTNTKDVFICGKWNEFRKLAMEEININLGLNIRYYYESYVLTYVYDNVMKHVNTSFLSQATKRINETSCQALISSATTKHNNAKQRIASYEHKEDIKPFRIKDLMRASNSYIDSSKKFSDTVIYCNANIINFNTLK